MHGAGPVLRTLIGRANTWQLVVISVALVAIGAVLVAVGHLRAGIVGVVGLVLLWSIVSRRLGRAKTSPGDRADEEPS
ncbi:MAG TPA: hypothetical protein VMD28_04975 [Acidimicrobiales bacterium]|nr:hypothetical protein [Acidimicrobiales bacterium]